MVTEQIERPSAIRTTVQQYSCCNTDGLSKPSTRTSSIRAFCPIPRLCGTVCVSRDPSPEGGRENLSLFGVLGYSAFPACTMNVE
ncbi:hypothetical protein ZHAS_00016958 [Anopheles sinensis]|uniref:Uncharacterized protein n=1 Tax=Anopheles sinensis TaxID=74873 RepID=A0A084WFG3_ANOSI|nr:hypothetical protein ZHAS_00016958 [Anopheles sinensis]